MPAEAIHLTALREGLASPRVASSARRRVMRREDEARLGAVLVDLPYFDRFPEEVARYLVRAPARPAPWGQRLHDEGPVLLLVALLRRGRRDDGAAAIALGLASHAAIDRALHPLINALATARQSVDPAADHGTLHREVEKFQSVCFHEDYAGTDAMGTPAIGRRIDVALAPVLADHPAGEAVASALAEAFADAPSRETLARWGRGYRSYTRLLASPLGKLLAPPSAKAWGRPTYTRGAWGDFAALLERAIACSVEVIDAADAVLEASERDVDDALSAFLKRFPRGTIDDLGSAVDLSRPFDPRSLRARAEAGSRSRRGRGRGS